MKLDIDYNGIRLGSYDWITSNSSRLPEEYDVPRSITFDIYHDGGYIFFSPEETLKLGSKVDRVNKDIYIMAVFGDLLRKYHERFKRNASMDLHEQLRYRAAAIVEDLW